jgi:DNA-binding response OmpR family regulator
MATRIMVINDTQEILELFREILTDEGYEVVLYSYTIQELEEIERVKPDLIILDYIMGHEESGWQLLQKLKMRRSTESIPVVVCSAAKNLIEQIQGNLTSMGVGVVLKPFNIDELLLVVKHTLDSHPDLPSEMEKD